MEAVKILLKRNTPLFDSMAKQLDSYGELREMIEEIIYQGRQISFSPMEKSVNLGVMFGFLKEENGCVAVANRIFEMALLNMFAAQEAVRSEAFGMGSVIRISSFKAADSIWNWFFGNLWYILRIFMAETTKGLLRSRGGNSSCFT